MACTRPPPAKPKNMREMFYYTWTWLNNLHDCIDESGVADCYCISLCDDAGVSYYNTLGAFVGGGAYYAAAEDASGGYPQPDTHILYDHSGNGWDALLDSGAANDPRPVSSTGFLQDNWGYYGGVSPGDWLAKGPSPLASGTFGGSVEKQAGLDADYISIILGANGAYSDRTRLTFGQTGADLKLTIANEGFQDTVLTWDDVLSGSGPHVVYIEYTLSFPRRYVITPYVDFVGQETRSGDISALRDPWVFNSNNGINIPIGGSSLFQQYCFWTSNKFQDNDIGELKSAWEHDLTQQAGTLDVGQVLKYEGINLDGKDVWCPDYVFPQQQSTNQQLVPASLDRDDVTWETRDSKVFFNDGDDEPQVIAGDWWYYKE